MEIIVIRIKIHPAPTSLAELLPVFPSKSRQSALFELTWKKILVNGKEKFLVFARLTPSSLFFHVGLTFRCFQESLKFRKNFIHEN